MYIPAPVTEMVWTTLDPVFGKDARRTAVIFKALYGLKLIGAAFRSHLARCMESLQYVSCKALPELWLKSEIRPEDVIQYYSYLWWYVDDILCIQDNAVAVLQQLHQSFLLKLGLIIQTCT